MTESAAQHRLASRYLERHRTALAAELAEYLFATHPDLRIRFGTYGLERATERLEGQLDALHNTLALGTSLVFAEDLAWFEAEVEFARSDGLDALGFGSLLSEARRFLNNRLPVTEAKVVDRFIESALRRRYDSGLQTSYIGEDNPFGEIAERLLKLLLNDERAAASALMFSTAQAGIPLGDLYAQVLQPVQYEVGRLWESGEISVAREHYCTAAILSIMSELYPFYGASVSGNEPTLVLAAIGEEPHTVGLRMMTDLLEMEGWRVCLLTKGVTAGSIEEALEQWDAEVLAVSATMSSHLLEVEQIIDAVHASSKVADTKVMVGGRPFIIDHGLWGKVGADGTAFDAAGAVQLAGLFHGCGADSSPHRPAGTIWWCRQGTPRWQMVRDGLGLTAGDSDDEKVLRSVLGLLMEEGGPREVLARTYAGGQWREQMVCVDAVKYHDVWVAAAAKSPSELERTLNEGRDTLEAFEEVLELLAVGEHETSTSGESLQWGLSGLYSELTQLQRELVLKKASLEAVQRDRDALLAMVAHDMRNALAIIDANSFFLSELLKDHDIPEEVFEHLKAIARRSEIVLELAADLQELAHLESGTIERRPVALKSLVEEEVRNAQTIAAKKNIDVELRAVEEVPEVRGDAKLLRRLLDNLLSNASKFSPPDTTIHVEMSAEQEYACVLVRDEGLGIPQEEVKNLYDLFFLGSARPTAGEKSTGLGLPIVKRIVDAHSGDIEVDSKVGEGTTFVVRLPAEGGR